METERERHTTALTQAREPPKPTSPLPAPSWQAQRDNTIQLTERAKTAEHAHQQATAQLQRWQQELAEALASLRERRQNLDERVAISPTRPDSQGFRVKLKPMKTPEPVTAEQAGSAATRILNRRRQIDDPHLDEFIVAGHETRELIQVALKRRRGLPDWVAEADVHDVLVLHVRQWWDWVAEDLAVLEQGERLVMNRKDVGRILNLGSGQAIPDRIQARRGQLAKLRGEPDPDELTDMPREDRSENQQRWLNAHRETLDHVRAAILAHKDLGSDEAYESLLDVAGEPWTPGTITLMSYAVFEFRQSPAVTALSDEHPLQTALDEWAALAEQYRRAR